MQPAPLTRSQRVIVANEPRLFREMLRRAINKIPGLAVVGEVADLEALLPMLAETGAEWVIVSLTPSGQMPEGIEPLLVTCPSLRILGVAGDGSRVHIKWVEFHEESLEGLSLDELSALLCTRPTWNWPRLHWYDPLQFGRSNHRNNHN